MDSIKSFLGRGANAIVVLLLLACVIQIPYFCHAEFFFDSDEAYNALLSQRMLHGNFHSLSLPGAPYQGVLEPLCSIPLQLILGPTAVAYKAGIFGFCLIYIIFAFATLRLLGISKPLAFISMLPFALGSWQLKALAFFGVGGHMTITALGSMALYFMFLYRQAAHKKNIYLFACACLLGLAYYTYSLAICYLMLVLLVQVFEKGLTQSIKDLFLTRSGASVLAGFALGVLPLLLKKLWHPIVAHGSYFQIATPAKIYQSFVLLWTQCVPYLIGVNYAGNVDVQNQLLIQVRGFYGVVSSVYAWVFLSFVVFLLVYYWTELRLYLQFKRRPLMPGAIMILGVYIMMALILATPAMLDLPSRRYLLPLLSFLPFLLAEFFQFIARTGGKTALKGVAVLLLVFVVLHQYTFLSQNALLGGVPTQKEQALREVLGFLNEEQIPRSFSEYWISHKLTYLAQGRHVSITGPDADRDAPYTQVVLDQMRAEPSVPVAYVFFKGSIAGQRWQAYAQAQHLAYQTYENSQYVVVYGLPQAQRLVFASIYI